MAPPPRVRWAVSLASWALAASLSHVACAQDDGQLAVRLRPMINGTLPNSTPFQAQSTSVDPSLAPFELTASLQVMARSRTLQRHQHCDFV